MAENEEKGTSELRAALDSNKKKRRTGVIAGIAVVAAAALVAGGVLIANSLNGGGTPADAAEGTDTTEPLSLRIAVSEDNDFQTTISEVAAEKNLTVEWVNVNDWVLPNTELAAGSVDGNAFQHILYLSNFNATNDETLTPLFSTLITQWGIFSATLDSTDAFPDGARIAIPDDPSNSGRALFILQAAGLIELSEDAGDFPTTDDIVANPKHIEVVPIAATTIPQQFDDPSLSGVVVGTSYFDPSQNIGADDALYLDDSLDEKNLPYVNVIASRADNADNPAWKILEEVYADPRVATAVDEEYFGNTVLVKVPIESLRDKLADLEVLAKANQ
ncbi:MAG: MetQ/NlpA family ABC transporter substrate-binding protein [Rhodoglobus sp.]